MRVISWVVTIAIIVALAATDLIRHRAEPPVSFTAFSPTQRGCTIVIPFDALPQEREAAELLRATFAKSSGIPEARFPVIAERGAAPRNSIFVGATRRERDFLAATAPKPPFDTAVGLRVHGGAAFLRSERRESTESAASWLLETQLGAHWFMPGSLGEHVPARTEVTLPPGEQIARPGFLSRDLGIGGSAEERAWYARSRLEARFDHGHNLVNIFKPDDFRRNPEMASLRNGVRFIPASGSDYSWQPNMLSAAAVEHAASVAIRAFDADPKRVSFSLSENDTTRFDESPETLAAVAPARYFRHRPDYSNLVFRFTNAIAERVARRHPDRWLPAYAYYWCENTPDFRVAPNIVPFLTADRTQWSHADFAAEDRALIERWCHSGAKIVGVYDYFEGAPFLCPRPMLYAVKESIPFEYRAGVRAFYGEGSPNWGLDGPKLWLAAQLLWSPQQSPDELLEIYFREFWAEAAGPMREFFALCERTWRELPGPALWLRFYEEEDHAFIYSTARLAELRRSVDAAARVAQTPVVRERVAFTSAALAMTERFAEFCAARRQASLAARPGTPPDELLAMWKRYREARVRFVTTLNEVRRERPLALSAPQELEMYLRNQPDSRIARELARTEQGRALLRENPELVRDFIGAASEQIAAVASAGVECLIDGGWKNLLTRPVDSSNAYEWTQPGQLWWGNGEPWEGRSVELQARDDGRRVLRIAGSRIDRIGQWVSATPNALYAAQVKVRAKVSPGTTAFLIVGVLDQNGRHTGLGRVDRVPLSDQTQELELCVVVKAPANAGRIGFGLQVLGQINDDFVEFSDASLRVKLE